MDAQNLENSIKEQLKIGQVKFEISEPRKALVLSVSKDSELVKLLDDLFNLSRASLAPLDSRRSSEPVPMFRIDRYSVTPTPREKRFEKGCYLYDFSYTPK